MRIISKPLLSALTATSAALLAPHAARADGRLEAGVTVGGHVFSSNGELGVTDKDSAASPQSSALLGGRLGYMFLPQLTGELEAVLIPTVDDDESRGAAVFGVRAHARYEPFGETLMQGRLHPFLLAGYGFMAVRTDSMQLKNDADQAYDWGLGTHYTLTSAMELRIDARHVIVPDRSKNGATSNFEIAAGLTWRFGPGSSGRGAQRLASAVPTASPPAAPPPNAATPGQTPVAAAAPTAPAPAAVTSAPGTAPTAATSPGATAPVADTDKDGDGIFAPQDGCPFEAEDKDGHQDGDGCPDADNDSDGIGDSIDRCANDAETVNGYADGDGCPDAQHPDLVAVPFARSSANFTAESAALLDKAYQVLQSNPGFRIELGGHSSSDESSRTLSLQRAEAVKDYLVRRGVAEARLRVIGYRSEQPATHDKSAAGKAKNRRVEMRLLPLDAAPTPAR